MMADAIATTMGDVMLTVRDLAKRYGRTAALEGVSFDLAPGRVLALVGANGAGKTTLIRSVVGLARFEGSVAVCGIDVARRGPAVRRHIGYLAQQPAFHDDMSVQETAIFYARLRGVSEAEARRSVGGVGLEPHASKTVGALSGGMRQRLGLAIAQLGAPSLYVLDEPASGLDVAARLELREFIRAQRAEGHSVLLATHWLEDVPTTADEVLVLDRGHVQFHGPAGRFVLDHAPRSRIFLRLNGHTPEAIPLIEAASGDAPLRAGEWLSVTCPTERKARVLETLVASGITILDFRVEEATTMPAPDSSPFPDTSPAPDSSREPATSERRGGEERPG